MNRLLTQMERILKVNALREVSKAVVEATRESLVIGDRLPASRENASRTPQRRPSMPNNVDGITPNNSDSDKLHDRDCATASRMAAQNVYNGTPAAGVADESAPTSCSVSGWITR